MKLRQAWTLGAEQWPEAEKHAARSTATDAEVLPPKSSFRPVSAMRLVGQREKATATYSR